MLSYNKLHDTVAGNLILCNWSPPRGNKRAPFVLFTTWRDIHPHPPPAHRDTNFNLF